MTSDDAASVAQAASDDAELALAFFDLLAGEVLATVVPGGAAAEELLRMGAREVLGAAEVLTPMSAQLRRAGVAVRPDAGAASSGRPSGVAAGSGAGAASGSGSGATRGDDDAASVHRAEVRPPVLRLAPHAKLEWSPAQLAAIQRAGSAALGWASHTQRHTLAHVAPAQLYRLQDALVMDASTRQNLELLATQQGGERQGSLLHHLDCCRTPLGARLLRRWLLAPLRSPAAIARRADVVDALVAQPEKTSALRSALAQVRDLERLAGRVAVGRATPRDLLGLGTSVTQLGEVAAAVAKLDAPLPEVLSAAWRQAPLPRALGARLTAALVPQPPTSVADGGVFARGHDARLDELIALTDDAEAWLRQYEADERRRTGLSGLRVRYNRVFGYTVELSRSQGRELPAGYVRRQTLANVERFVTPALERFEVRAASASAERRAREAELLAALLDEVAEVLPQLAVLARLTAKTDVLAALAEVALQHRYVRPNIVAEPRLSLEGARHPVLEALMPQGERFVANDTTCDADGRQLTVLTGPNMAGKSTVMRQAALCCVLAQMGGFVPARHAEVGVVDHLFVRVGASDNLSRGQSTFMVEMVETATILRQATRHSLVLLDEIGRGTSTFDGLSLAWAVAEHLHHHVGCRTLFATHYHELTALCRSLPRAVAMQMRVHEVDGTLVFLRQLAEGASGRSYGIEVAKLAGVPAAVLARARQVLAALEHDEVGVGGPTAPWAAPVPASGGAPVAAPIRLPRRTQLEMFAAVPPAPPARAMASGEGGVARADEAGPQGPPSGGPAVAPNEARVPPAWGARLRQLELAETTPLEALQLLHELQQALRDADARRGRRPGGGAAGVARAAPSALLT